MGKGNEENCRFSKIWMLAISSQFVVSWQIHISWIQSKISV